MCVAFMSSSVAMLAQERLDMLCFALESMAGFSHLGNFAFSLCHLASSLGCMLIIHTENLDGKFLTINNSLGVLHLGSFPLSESSAKDVPI